APGRRPFLPEPLDLILTERAHSLTLVLEHVDEPDEVRALVVEALPAALSHRALAVPAQIFRAAVQKDVVLARHVEHALGLHGLEHLRQGVEGPRLLAVGLITRVDHERRRRPQRVDTIEQLLERRRRIAVRLALEADVRVADLHEVEAAARGLRGFCGSKCPRGQHAAGRGPDEGRARPGHALQKASSIESIHVSLLMVGPPPRPGRGPSRSRVTHHFTITLARMCGWSAQKYSYVPGRV